MRGIVALIIFLLAAASAGAFVVVEHWGVYDDGPFYEFVENDVSLNIEDIKHDDSIKVVFTAPELGARASKGPYDPEGLRHDDVYRQIVLPWDAEAGEYVIRMTITDSQGNKRVRHRIIEIE